MTNSDMSTGNAANNRSAAARKWLWSAFFVLLAHPLAAQTLSLSDHAVLPGGSVAVPILLGDATGVASVSLTVNFDPELLVLDAVTNGGLGQTFSLDSTTVAGSIRIAAVRDTALLGGSGSLVILQFHANTGAVPGLASAVTLADRALGGQFGRDLGQSQTATHRNGSVTVVSLTQDSNSNSLPDWWEEANFGGPTNANLLADDDGDGMSNLQEFLAGTNPHDRNSALHIQSVSMKPSGFEIEFPSVAGKLYRVEFSDDLQAWQAMSPDVTGTGGSLQVPIATAAGDNSRFYRLKLVP